MWNARMGKIDDPLDQMTRTLIARSVMAGLIPQRSSRSRHLVDLRQPTLMVLGVGVAAIPGVERLAGSTDTESGRGDRACAPRASIDATASNMNKRRV
jgi:hypothetical protein